MEKIKKRKIKKISAITISILIVMSLIIVVINTNTFVKALTIYGDFSDDLIAYYRFNEEDSGSGTIIDEQGNFNLTNDGASNTTGITNYAYDFESTQEDNMDRNAIAINDNFTISAWFRTESLGSVQVIAFQGYSAYPNPFQFGIHVNNSIRFAYGGHGTTSYNNIYSTKPVLADTWYHIVGTYNEIDGGALYINGELNQSSEDLEDIEYAGTLSVGVRWYDGTGYFDGIIDEVGIWNRTLNSTEISNLYNSGSYIEYEEAVSDDSPEVTLNSPSNDEEFESDETITFNCTATDDLEIENVTFYLDGTANETNTSGISGVYIFEKDLIAGDYNWSCGAYDNGSNYTEATYRDLSVIDPELELPTIVTLDADTIGSSYANLKGNLTSLGDYDNTTVIFQYKVKTDEIINPYEDVDFNNDEVYKSNFHTHTTESDGSDTVAERIEEYDEGDYDILSITDHDTMGGVATTWAWDDYTGFSDTPFWTETNGAMETSEYFNTTIDMMAVRGNEITAYGNGNLDHDYASLFNDYGTGTDTIEQGFANISSKNGLIHFVHPDIYQPNGSQNMFASWEDTVDWYNTLIDDYRDNVYGFVVETGGTDTRESTAYLWDLVNKERDYDDLIWAVADTDEHNMATEERLNKKYNFHFMENLSESELRESMVNGKFTASKQPDTSSTDVAPRLTNVTINETNITIDCSSCESIIWFDENSTIINDSKVTNGNQSIDITGFDSNFVRAVLYNEDGFTYVQPFGYYEAEIEETWTNTSEQILDELGTFNHNATGLSGGSNYDFRAVMIEPTINYTDSLEFSSTSTPPEFYTYNPPLVYYKLDEQDTTGNGIIIDEAGNYNMTNDGADNSSGKILNAYDFESSSTDKINRSAITIADNFSVSIWIKLESINAVQHIISQSSSALPEPFDLKIFSNNSIGFSYGSAGDYVNQYTKKTLSADTWYHIVGTYNEIDGGKIYIDGTLNDTHSGTYSLSNSGKLIIGGRSDGTGYFDGIIDEVSIFNKTLNATEVSDLYNGGDGLAFNPQSQVPYTTLISPQDEGQVGVEGSNFTANLNITDTYSLTSNYTWINTTYLIYNSTHLINETTKSITGTNNYSNLFIGNFLEGNHYWDIYSCYGNASYNACIYSQNGNFTFEAVPFAVTYEEYNNYTTEGSTESFIVNFSLDSQYRLSDVYLVYNGSSYSTTVTEYTTNNYRVNKSLIIPETNETSNVSFYWNITTETGFSQTSTQRNQTIYNLGIDDCSSYSNLLFNFTLVDEETQETLDGVPDNTSIKVDLIFSSLTGSSEIVQYSTLFDEENPASVCIDNLITSENLRIDGVIEYSSLGRFVEFYHLQNYILTADSDAQNITLYNLNSSVGEDFKITYKNSNFVPVVNALFNIQRKYIDEGVFKTVEIPKTSIEGYTIGHLVPSEVIYNILVYQEGVILASFEEVVADCQNPSLQSCEINLNPYLTSTAPETFENARDLNYKFSYNESTRELSVLFAIPSGLSSTVGLNVTLFDSVGNRSLCNDLLVSSGGTLSCTIPIGFSNSTVIARLTKDSNFITQAVLKLNKNANDVYGGSIIFIALIGMLIFIGIGASSDNPMITNLIILVGFIVLIALQIVYTPSWIGAGATILWLVIAIIILFIKGGNRQ